jgi:hypothetical protein
MKGDDVIARYEAKLADKQTALESAHYLIGWQEWQILDLQRRLAKAEKENDANTDLRHRLAEAEDAVSELRALNERARDAA